jgi:preprotein translocase subunit Sss1
LTINYTTFGKIFSESFAESISTKKQIGSNLSNFMRLATIRYDNSMYRKFLLLKTKPNHQESKTILKRNSIAFEQSGQNVDLPTLQLGNRNSSSIIPRSCKMKPQQLRKRVRYIQSAQQAK